MKNIRVSYLLLRTGFLFLITLLMNGCGGGSNSTNPNSTSTSPLTVVAQPANDLVWDSLRQVIYLSIPSSAPSHANTISVLDPFSGRITASQAAGPDPSVLAISDDGQFLYAGIDGASIVQRFILPSLTPDIQIPLGSDPFNGPYFALDVQVAPGTPHTIAITLGAFNHSPEALGGLVVFDDATSRSTELSGFPPNIFDSLQWGADATQLFGANNEVTSFDIYTMTVNSSGLVLDHDFPNLFNTFFARIHYEPGAKLLYTDSGPVIDPSTGTQAGKFNSIGPMVPDAVLHRAFFVDPPNIQSFDLTSFTLLNSFTVSDPTVSGGVGRLIRWGSNGLAFNTSGGQVVLFHGSLVQ
jgi:hypothetical protein